MHLHGEQLERYHTRDLPQPVLAAIDAHVSSCMYCSRGLAQVAAASEDRWERRGWLGRLVRLQEPQPVATILAEEDTAPRAA